jgi:ribosomal protein S18 acetylase RimI-like enzyme
MDIRTAGHSDLEQLASLMTEAFAADPLWRWAFHDLDGLRQLWRFFIESALRYPCVSIADDYAAAAVWIPPGGVELTREEAEQVEPLLRNLVGSRAPDVLALLERLERAHPMGTPHYYLSLFGTASRHRGRGLGMTLLRENLRRIDDEGAPAYLESSNPTNDRRYEAVGFCRVGSCTTPDEAHAVTTMWRDATSNRQSRPA